MDVTRTAYIALLAAAGAWRLAELAYSRRNQQRLLAQGAPRVSEPRFAWMVLLHTVVIIGSGVEVVLLHRPFIPALAIPMFVVFMSANALRWWVIGTMRSHWNVQVMDSVRLGVVTTGPYRWVRHPNYVAVFVELVSLPLIYSAWITAIFAAIGNAWVLHNRLAIEDRVLLADEAYRAAMGGKPRFLPKLL